MKKGEFVMKPGLHASDQKTHDRFRTTSTRFKIAAMLSPVLVLLFILLGCTPHTYSANVEKITNQTLPTTGTDLPIDTAIFFTVSGTGVCTMQVDWGDGSSEQMTQDLGAAGAQGVVIKHTYAGWTGLKKVTARGVGDCSGDTYAYVKIGPSLPIAFAPGSANACEQMTPDNMVRLNLGALTAGSTVHVRWINPPGSKIDFGCLLSGCVYGPDGEPNSVAPADYPFPGLRKYSFVIRVGTQVVQGGSDVTFTVAETGWMEWCVNDNDLSNNSKGWGIAIDVDS
jgi:hypothetical protein